jgi:hypothetical protein
MFTQLTVRGGHTVKHHCEHHHLRHHHHRSLGRNAFFLIRLMSLLLTIETFALKNRKHFNRHKHDDTHHFQSPLSLSSKEQTGGSLSSSRNVRW